MCLRNYVIVHTLLELLFKRLKNKNITCRTLAL